MQPAFATCLSAHSLNMFSVRPEDPVHWNVTHYHLVNILVTVQWVTTMSNNSL